MPSNTRNVIVGLNQVAELKPPRNGRNSLLIVNESAAAIRYDFGYTPSGNTGVNLDPGGTANIERDDRISQQTLFIIGTTSGQVVSVTETFATLERKSLLKLVREFFE